MPRSSQEWVHWLELGGGAALIRRAALMLGVVLLSLWICYKQFQGPSTETTIEQAVVGRQLASGSGYTTTINYPQVAALLQERGESWSQPFPELFSAPLYPGLIGLTFGLMPEWFRQAIFEMDPEPPNGFIPDYVLLGLNVVLFWIAALQTNLLARRVFDSTVGLVAAAAVLLSAPLWQQVVAVNGTALSMVLFLGLMQVSVRAHEKPSGGTVPWGWLITTGVMAGLLCLTDYHAGFAFLPIVVFTCIRFSGQRMLAVCAVLLGFLLVTCPWSVWQIARTGSPVGLAWQEVAMRVDGSAADPGIVRGTLSTDTPNLSLPKLMNKGLSELQTVFQERFWSAGGMLFAAFFIAGFLYRFRNERVNTFRWLFASVLVVLVLAHGFLTAGASERHPLIYAAPVVILLGTGFAAVLIASSERYADHAGWLFALLLAAHAVPLAQDALEPRRLHFSYPPYYPTLFLGMKDEMTRRGGDNPGWMADVPAGASWYSGQRVWAQPANLRDFYAIGADQPMLALVLTPKTLDRPFFSELARRTDASRLGEWADIYAGLPASRLPSSFPLNLPQKVSDNLYVLIDPLAQPLRTR